jgi:hypothetical protein
LPETLVFWRGGLIELFLYNHVCESCFMGNGRAQGKCKYSEAKRNDVESYETRAGEIFMPETWACMSIQAATLRVLVRLRQGLGCRFTVIIETNEEANEGSHRT